MRPPPTHGPITTDLGCCHRWLWGGGRASFVWHALDSTRTAPGNHEDETCLTGGAGANEKEMPCKWYRCRVESALGIAAHSDCVTSGHR